jgi:hypothetical protein
MVTTILPLDVELGIFAGLAVAMAGFLKAYSKRNDKGEHEKFSIDKFFMTVVLGAAIGGMMTYLSSLDWAVMIFLSTAGTTVIVESIIKAFLRMKD